RRDIRRSRTDRGRRPCPLRWNPSFAGPGASEFVSPIEGKSIVKPRYLQLTDGGRDRWMISYMDVLTILLIFFVSGAALTMNRDKPTPAPVPQPVAATPI